MSYKQAHSFKSKILTLVDMGGVGITGGGGVGGGVSPTWQVPPPAASAASLSPSSSTVVKVAALSGKK